MKHIRTFEKNVTLKYKIGSIVVCYKFELYEELYVVAKIDARFPLNLPYLIESIYQDNFNLWVNEDDIRLATKTEIDDIEIKRDANKYNL